MWNRWSLGFIPKELAFGILSVLLPLYLIEEISGNLMDVGLIFFVKGIIQIPAVVLWARYIEKKAGCKFFILISFLISSLLIFLLTVAESVWSFLGLNVMLSFFYVAHRPATRVLIAESVPSSEWDDGFARHNLVLNIGGMFGLLAGAFWLTRLSNKNLMLLCGALVSISLILSMILIQDPPLMIERRFVRFERFVYLAEQASYNLAYAPTDEFRKSYLTRYPNPKPLILGIFLFPLASSMVFTLIPIFLSQNIGASSSLIFLILLIKSITTLIGYTLIRTHMQNNGLRMIKMASILRIFFPMLILVSGFLPFYLSLTLNSLALVIAGFAWPYFSVPSTTLWMETAPKGTAGIYTACVNLGVALGSLLGGLISSYYGYEPLFILSTAIFGLSLFFFTFSARMKCI